MGLTAESLWALSPCEFDALKKQWQRFREYQLSMLAAVRADLHNTAGKSFSHKFEVQDFLAGSSEDHSVEARVKALIAQGYTPSAAAAIATSKQTTEHKLFLIDSMCGKAPTKKAVRRKQG